MFRCIFGCILCFVVIFACTELIPQKIQKYLEPVVYVDSDDPVIAEKSKALTGNIKDKVQCARVLFEFVRDKIDEKYYEESFQASEILKAERGVCHQKAVLLTALYRAAGIPARIAFNEVHIKGYIHSEKGRLDVHKFTHGITEMYLNGQWLKVDATGNIKRWKIWVQDDPVEIDLPLEFKSDEDVVFPSVGRIVVKETDLHLFDWDEAKVEKVNEDFFDKIHGSN